MKPTHPLLLLACAIATQEGDFHSGTIPVLRNNPGDIDFAGQLGASRPPAGSPLPDIAVIDTKKRGIVKLLRQLLLQIDEGQTVRQIIAQWDQSTQGVYLKNVLEWTGLPADVPVIDLMPDLVALNVPTT